MATSIKETQDESTQTGSGSLADFSFSNDNEFFGQKIEEIPDDEVITEVKTSTKATTTNKSTDIKDIPTTKASKKEVDDEIDEDDDEEDTTTFFNDKSTKPSTTKVKEDEDEEEDDEEDKTEAGKAKPSTKTSSETKKIEEKGEEEDKDEEGNEDDAEFYTTLSKELKDKGIFQAVELKDGEKITEEKFFELQDQELEARVEETLAAMAEDMDEEAKDFLRFKKNGGKTADFISTYATGGLNIENFDENDPKQVDKVIKHYLSTIKNLDEDEVEDHVKLLEENGTKKAKAVKYFTNIQEIEAKKRENLLATQQKNIANRENNAKKFNAELINTINTVDTIGAFSISKEEKKELANFITRPTVKVGNGKYVPELQTKLAAIFKADTKESKEQLILLAKLIKTNFDVSEVARTASTKTVKAVKSNLQRVKSGVKPASSGTASKKSIVDYFDV